MAETMQLTEEQRKALEEKLKKMSPEELKEFQRQQCVFCQIISDKIPSKKIYEDDHCLAILDINPAAKGHLLLLPKEHQAIMPQMDDKSIAHLLVIAKKLSQTLLRGLKVAGTSVFIANGIAAGQRAQHLIIHIIPRREGDGIIPLEEKLIDKELRKKVNLLLVPKLNSVLGIKTESANKNEENEEPKEKPEPKKREQINNKTTDKRESKNKPKTKENGAKNKEVSLDDIANLFK